MQLDDISTETPVESLPAIVATLIAGAVATFDADRTTCRRYLLQASSILRASAPPEARVSRGGLPQWQLNRVVSYIEERLPERITVKDLANLIDVSTGQLFRTFKATVRVSPLRYVASRRVEFACSLLRTTPSPLAQIASNAGFCDQAHFCRVFRRILGVTPAAWRRANGPPVNTGPEQSPKRGIASLAA